MTATKSGIRALSTAEIEHFHSHGWVHARGLVPRKTATGLLELARERMGDEAKRTTGAGGGDPQFEDYRDILRNFLGCWRVEPIMRDLAMAPAMAKNASRLLRDRPIRFFNDELLVKPPAESGGRATPWHQDLPHTQFDRTCMVNIWISLTDLPPDGGAMSFLSGSHRFGPLGRTLLAEEDALAQNRWLSKHCDITQPPAMSAGDATIHGDLTVHSGPAYQGPHWRWAYLINLFDATARFAGGPGYGEPAEGVEPNHPFPDDRYPLLYAP